MRARWCRRSHRWRSNQLQAAAQPRTAASTQSASHSASQQNGSKLQTQSATRATSHPGVADAVQQLPPATVSHWPPQK